MGEKNATKGRWWSNKEVQELKALWANNVPRHEVCEKLGRSLQAVRSKVSELRITRTTTDIRRKKQVAASAPPAHGSQEWLEAQNDRFCKAMIAAGYKLGTAPKEPYTPTARRYTPVSCPHTESSLAGNCFTTTGGIRSWQ